MKPESYREIVLFLQKTPFAGFSDLQNQFPDVNGLTLRSIASTERVRKTKKHFHLHSNDESSRKYFQWYKDTVTTEVSPGFVAEYAESELDLSPALFARILVEKFVENQLAAESSTTDTENLETSDSTCTTASAFKKSVSDQMRDPKSIPDGRLGREIWICILKDEVYGPLTESMKHIFGEEKEQLLKEKLKSRKIPFFDEHELRSQGYDKTPDIKLEIPCVLNGNKVVNWIESKGFSINYVQKCNASDLDNSLRS